MTRELELVELVDATGAALGESTVEAAHTAPGALHRAFSVLLTDPDGRTLLQRRAGTKTRFPARWANTCCGHPAPGEGVVDAATRRLGEELGLRSVGLTEIGVYVYRATDPATGRVEHEYDHVLMGRGPVDAAPVPDPAEVSEVRWSHPSALTGLIADRPDDYAPWLAGVLDVARSQGLLPE
jgi:isopentenyl-diphosphate delta-isomerase